MNDPYTRPPTIDPHLLEASNAGTRAAVAANRAREARENHLDSLYFYSAPAKWVRK